MDDGSADNTASRRTNLKGRFPMMLRVMCFEKGWTT